MDSPIIFNHNNIICESKDEAIALAKSTSLKANEPIAVRYSSYVEAPHPLDPSQTYQKEVIRVIVAIGTGYADNPVEIINDISSEDYKAYSRSMDEPVDKSLIWIDTNPTGPMDFNNRQQASNLVKILKMINTLCNRMDRVEYAFKYGIQCGTTAHSADKELRDFKFTGDTPMTFDELVDYNADSDNDDYSGISKVYDDDLGNPEVWVKTIFPNLTHLGIKHDTLANMEKYIPKEYELIWCDDNPGLYIGISGKYIKVTGATGTIINPDGGGSSETDDPSDLNGKIVEHIDFATTDPNVTIRMKMQPDGTLRTYNAAEDDETKVAAEGSAENYKGLMISMVYAGAEGANASTYGVCSHSFVELYNNKDFSVNLRGLSLQFGKNGAFTHKVDLVGILPAHHCYLVRLAQCSSLDSGTTIVKIDKYDLDAPGIAISCNGVKVYLCVGTTLLNDSTNAYHSNPYSNPDKSNYIDFVGLSRRLKAGEDSSSNDFKVDCAEGTAPRLLQETQGAFRVYMNDSIGGFKVGDATITGGDTDQTKLDWGGFDYLSNNISENPAKDYKPWCREDGAKDLYYNKTKFNEQAPNMVTVSFGNAPGRRTFNWVSTDEKSQSLYLRNASDKTWRIYPSGEQMENQRVTHPNGQTTVTHRVIVGPLSAGQYIYKVGRPGFMSEEYNFYVNAAEANRSASFKFVQVTDQQGWYGSEYYCWKLAAKEVLKVCNGGDDVNFPNGNDGVHFFINTGDMSQNGTRPNEWLDYYNSAPWLANVCQMNTVGNNDLCPDPKKGTSKKISSTSFVYYYTYELDADHPQRDNYGEIIRSVYAFDYGCVHFVVFNSNEWIQEQIAWFKQHMADMEAKWQADPSTAPAWRIAVIHDAPLALTVDNDTSYSTIAGDTGLRNSDINQPKHADITKRFEFSRLLSQYNFQMSLSGHKHTYTRTKLVKERTYDDRENDTHVENGYFKYVKGETTNYLPVDYLNPQYEEGVQSTAANGSNVFTYTAREGWFINVMCQATGFKLASNKDVPAIGIPWLSKYFPGSNGKSAKAQKYPTYTEWTITPTQIKVVARQVKNLCNGGKIFDPFGSGCDSAEGFTKLDQITSDIIDTCIVNKPQQ